MHTFCIRYILLLFRIPLLSSSFHPIYHNPETPGLFHCKLITILPLFLYEPLFTKSSPLVPHFQGSPLVTTTQTSSHSSEFTPIPFPVMSPLVTGPIPGKIPETENRTQSLDHLSNHLLSVLGGTPN